MISLAQSYEQFALEEHEEIDAATDVADRKYCKRNLGGNELSFYEK